MAAVPLQYGTVIGPAGGVALLIFLSGAKLLELDTARDRMGLLFVGVFLLVAHFLDAQHLATAAYMVLAALALAAADRQEAGADRLVVGEPADDLVLVNPTIVGRGGADSFFDEGCLSFPGIYAEVRRPERCRVKAFDVEGRAIEAEYDGFVSRIVQHEYDHLEGVLLVDRMSPADKLRNRTALEELVARYKRAAPAGSR